jgi:hypothetical protein
MEWYLIKLRGNFTFTGLDYEEHNLGYLDFILITFISNIIKFNKHVAKYEPPLWSSGQSS